MSFYVSNEVLAEAMDEATGCRRTFGWQLRMELAGCNTTALEDPVALATWAEMLVKEIGMEAYGNPIIDRFGVGDLEGYTLVQRLTTSAMVLHCDPPDGAFIDVFSCRFFDPYAALRFCIGYFRATAATADFTERRGPATASGRVEVDFAAADRYRVNRS